MASPLFCGIFLIVAMGRTQAQCDAVQLVTRQQWGARPPKDTAPLYRPANSIVIHHTSGRPCYTLSECRAVVKDIQEIDMDAREENDIVDNFLIGEDGRVYEGRGWDSRSSHSTGPDYSSYDISFIGNFKKLIPNDEALNATKALLKCAVEKRNVMSDYQLHGHRDISVTSCPGDALYAVIQTWDHYKKSRKFSISRAGTLQCSVAFFVTSSLLLINIL